ncbi:hypothetical protein sos41_13060 [Alphaproteobacteria bacterium SO-S41]|nr:hypothetical protein sos41_13060 [Alphaproteobacteria bacterium SO-S41]
MMTARLLAAMLAAVLGAAAPAFAQEPAPRTMTTTAPAAAEAKPAPKKPPAAPAAATPAPATPQPAKPQAAAGGGSETIRISADTSKGFARVSFLWARPVTFEASIADGILIVRFARPFKLASDQLKVPLDNYASIIRLDPDGRTLRLSLTQKVRLHTSAAGPLVGIDLLPTSYRGEPADVVDPTAPPPPDPGPIAVKLKIGVDTDKTQLSFDWGKSVKYEATVKDGKINVVFAHGGSIDVTRLQKTPPAFVKGATSTGGDDKVLLEITVDPESPVEHRQDKNRIVFDIMAPRNDKDVEPEIIVPEGIRPTAEGEPEPAHEPEHAEPAPHGEPAGHDEPPKEAADAHEGETAPPAGSDGAAVADAEHEAAAPEPPHEEPKEGDAAGDDHHVEAAPAEDHHAEAAPAEEHHADEPPAVAPDFKVARAKNEITLTLPALDTAPAAMFKRGDTIFILLKSAGAIDPDALIKGNKDVVAAATVRQEKDVTVFSITLAKPYAVTAGVLSDAWIATISPDPLDPPRPIALLRDARTVGPARVRATLDRSGPVVELADPKSGERLLVATASGEPQGIIGARTYVDFAADPTAQGLVVRPFADDLTLVPDEHDVLISSPGGLTLSAGTVSDYAPERAALGDATHPAAMDFKAWAGEGAFLDERSHRITAIHPNGDNITEARIDLARFYLAYDLGAEALGALQLLVADDETIVGDPSFRALRGAALILLARPKQALDEFASSSLDDDPNAELFRGVAAAELSQWSVARDAIISGEAAIADFRPDWQARFRVAGARAALETNAVDVADRMLGAMPKEGVPRPFAIEADLLRGELAQRLKRDAEALRLYGEVKASGYRPLAVQATLAEIVLQEQTGELKSDDAIKALDDLRWQWRGDGLELGVLHKLAGLQVAKGDYRNGLQTMRAAVLGFPEEDEARRIGTEMSAVFEDLFLRGKADALPPIQALGLYYDFKELTPIGTLGDEMVRRLADRLIAVDLLEQAAELLQHQVDRRLDGVAKAQIAAKLAAVYLMDRKPEKALAALRASSQTRLPDDLAGQRRLLMGRALSDLKQYDAALEAFEQDDSPEALRLRADVMWAATRWVETAAAVEVLIAGREKNPAPLDATDRYDILRAAVAYTMADDDKGLASLRDRFVAMMANAPEAAAFEVVTRAVDPSGVAFRDTAKAIAGTDTLDAFLQSLGLGRPAAGTAEATP